MNAPALVLRYLLTQAPDADGLRTLAQPAQGRYTYGTPEEAAAVLAATMANNPPDVLASTWRLPLQVQAVQCYPGHFDPMQTCWADDLTPEEWEMFTGQVMPYFGLDESFMWGDNPGRARAYLNDYLNAA